VVVSKVCLSTPENAENVGVEQPGLPGASGRCKFKQIFYRAHMMVALAPSNQQPTASVASSSGEAAAAAAAVG